MKRCPRFPALLVMFLLAVSGAAGALSPSLSSQSTEWFEAGVRMAWSPVHGQSLFGWRFSFMLGTEYAFDVDFLLDSKGGYFTVGGAYYLNPFSADSTLAVPLSVGIGISRLNGDISFALGLSAALSWYPMTIAGPDTDVWMMGFGSEIGMYVYLLEWGVEPVLSAAILMPANLSLFESASPSGD